MGRYRTTGGDEDGNGGNGNRRSRNYSDVPYRDADTSIGEIPLDDIDTFIHPAKDEKGISSKMSLNLPPHMERQVQIVIRSGRFPYLRDADFVRHAIYRHLHFCVQLRNSIPKHLIPVLDAIGEVCRDQDIQDRMQEAFERIQSRILHLQRKGDTVEAARLVNLVRRRIDEVPASHWQRHFKVEFEKLYGDRTDAARLKAAPPPPKSESETNKPQ